MCNVILFRVVWLVRYGTIDIKGILHAIKKKDYITHVVNLVETSMSMVLRNPTRYKRSPDAIVQSTIIFDMEGFGMRHVTYKPGRIPFGFTLENLIIFSYHQFYILAMDAAFKIIQIYEANYPELLYRVFVINGRLNQSIRL